MDTNYNNYCYYIIIVTNNFSYATDNPMSWINYYNVDSLALYSIEESSSSSTTVDPLALLACNQPKKIS